MSSSNNHLKVYNNKYQHKNSRDSYSTSSASSSSLSDRNAWNNLRRSRVSVFGGLPKASLDSLTPMQVVHEKEDDYNEDHFNNMINNSGDNDDNHDTDENEEEKYRKTRLASIGTIDKLSALMLSLPKVGSNDKIEKTDECNLEDNVIGKNDNNEENYINSNENDRNRSDTVDSLFDPDCFHKAEVRRTDSGRDWGTKLKAAKLNEANELSDRPIPRRSAFARKDSYRSLEYMRKQSGNRLSMELGFDDDASTTKDIKLENIDKKIDKVDDVNDSWLIKVDDNATNNQEKRESIVAPFEIEDSKNNNENETKQYKKSITSVQTEKGNIVSSNNANVYNFEQSYLSRQEKKQLWRNFEQQIELGQVSSRDVPVFQWVLYIFGIVPWKLCSGRGEFCDIDCVNVFVYLSGWIWSFCVFSCIILRIIGCIVNNNYLNNWERVGWLSIYLISLVCQIYLVYLFNYKYQLRSTIIIMEKQAEIFSKSTTRRASIMEEHENNITGISLWSSMGRLHVEQAASRVLYRHLFIYQSLLIILWLTSTINHWQDLFNNNIPNMYGINTIDKDLYDKVGILYVIWIILSTLLIIGVSLLLPIIISIIMHLNYWRCRDLCHQKRINNNSDRNMNNNENKKEKIEDERKRNLWCFIESLIIDWSNELDDFENPMYIFGVLLFIVFECFLVSQLKGEIVSSILSLWCGPILMLAIISCCLSIHSKCMRLLVLLEDNFDHNFTVSDKLKFFLKLPYLSHSTRSHVLQQSSSSSSILEHRLRLSVSVITHEESENASKLEYFPDHLEKWPIRHMFVKVWPKLLFSLFIILIISFLAINVNMLLQIPRCISYYDLIHPDHWINNHDHCSNAENIRKQVFQGFLSHGIGLLLPYFITLHLLGYSIFEMFLVPKLTKFIIISITLVSTISIICLIFEQPIIASLFALLYLLIIWSILPLKISKLLNIQEMNQVESYHLTQLAIVFSILLVIYRLVHVFSIVAGFRDEDRVIIVVILWSFVSFIWQSFVWIITVKASWLNVIKNPTIFISLPNFALNLSLRFMILHLSSLTIQVQVSVLFAIGTIVLHLFRPYIVWLFSSFFYVRSHAHLLSEVVRTADWLSEAQVFNVTSDMISIIVSYLCSLTIRDYYKASLNADIWLASTIIQVGLTLVSGFIIFMFGEVYCNQRFSKLWPDVRIFSMSHPLYILCPIILCFSCFFVHDFVAFVLLS